VPPEIISDRYVFYRVPEYLQAYLDYNSRQEKLSLLPYENENFYKYLNKARIHIIASKKYYIVSNVAKGGVIKIFNKDKDKLIYNDCGIIGKLNNNKVVTSQWINPDYKIIQNENSWEVKGSLNYISLSKTFNLLKFLIFRVILLLFGWQPKLAHLIKGQIRNILILGQKSSPINFTRKLNFSDKKIKLMDEINLGESLSFRSLSIGDEFFVRYVPQSRYFQSQELNISGWAANKDELDKINKEKIFTREKIIS
jgi:hypothetical protein